VHTAPNNTWYNDYVMHPRSYSRGLRNRKTYANAITTLMLTFHSPAWCIAFVCLVISIDANVTDCHFASKLDVDEMWLRPIRLPVCVEWTVAQLFYTKTYNKTSMSLYWLCVVFSQLSCVITCVSCVFTVLILFSLLS